MLKLATEMQKHQKSSTRYRFTEIENQQAFKNEFLKI